MSKGKFWSYILIILGLLFSLYVLNKNIDSSIDADMSSELILGKLLHDEGGILSKDWCYSTELRVINTQIIYKLGFFIFDDWHKVHLFSIFCLSVILLSAYYFLLYRMGSKDCAILTGLALFLPFSNEYCNNVLLGGYYATHIFFVFMTLALLLPSDNPRWNKWLIFFNCFLAFVGGLNGARYAVVLYVPILVAISFLYISKLYTEKGKLKYLFFQSLSLLIVNFLGVIFNIKYLSKIYQFQHPETLSLNNFDFVQFVNFIFNSFMQICGYTGCQSVYSLQGLKTFSSLILVTLLILVFVLTLNKFSQISFTKKYIIIFSISSLLITSFFIVSSGNSSEIRYIIPSLASMLPILAIWLSEDKTKRKELVCGTFAICLFVQSFCLYFFPVVPRYNYKAAANWLKDNHYTQGIATFWHCAPIVELSNGEIKFWVTMSCYEIIDWMSMIMNDTLQCREKLFCLPEGNIFLLITDKERACDQSGLYADNKHLVYSYQGLNIYDYSSYRDLLDNILQKNILPVMRNNNYILPKTGISSPCMPLLKGRYNLIVNCKSNGVVKGSYLRKLSRDAFFKVKNPRSVVTFVLKDGENRVPIDIEDDSTLIDINIFNDSSNPLTVESITIDK